MFKDSNVLGGNKKECKSLWFNNGFWYLLMFLIVRKNFMVKRDWDWEVFGIF